MIDDATTKHAGAPALATAATAPTTLLGIDLGDKRIGLALGDPRSDRVTPLATLRRRSPERDAAAIARICAEQDVAAIVVGLPLLMDGSEGHQARLTRDWASGVEAFLGLPVRLRDERLSSEEALVRMGRAPRGRAGGPPSRAARQAWHARVDREAAAAIVQAEMDAVGS